MIKSSLYILIVAFAAVACAQQSDKKGASESNNTVSEEWSLSESQWKSRLTDQEFYVLREKGTERAFTGDLLKNKDQGVYVCAACKLPLFESKTKFESGTGWPSFYAPVNDANVASEEDNAFGMVRIEVLCSRCGGHLGHVFPDGPKPTGLRYCINSVSLDFEAR